MGRRRKSRRYWSNDKDITKSTSSTRRDYLQIPDPNISDNTTAKTGDKTDIPGFYFDPESNTYFRITPENRKYYQEKKRLALKVNSEPRAELIGASLSTELLNRQYQHKSPETFKRDVSILRLKMMKEIRRVNDTSESADFKRCQVMTGHPAFGSVVGAWTTSKGTVVYHQSMKTSSTENEQTGIINIHYQDTISDLCTGKIRDGLEFVLYVGTSAVPEVSETSSVVHLRHIRSLCDLTTPENRSDAESMNLNMEMDDTVLWSCAWNQNTSEIALGSEEFAILIDQVIYETRLPIPNENTFSVEFNQSGKNLYCGTNKGNLKCFDLRSSKLVKNVKLVRGLSYLKLLNSENHIIASCYDHKLLQVDLRTNKVVVEYMGHNNDHLKIPVSLSEKNDFLCSVGQDRFIRIWNLKNGDLLTSIPPVTHDTSCLPSAWFSEDWLFDGSVSETAVIINTGKDFIMYG